VRAGRVYHQYTCQTIDGVKNDATVATCKAMWTVNVQLVVVQLRINATGSAHASSQAFLRIIIELSQVSALLARASNCANR